MKNVIFDVGRVLIQWDVMPLLYEFLDDQARVDQFIQETNFFAWNLEMDSGQSFAKGVDDYSKKFPHYAHIFKAFDERWTDTVPGPINHTFNILDQLIEKNIPTYAITNFSHEKWPIACKMFPKLATSFIDTVVSGEVKMIKPDQDIFRLLLDRNNLDAQDCIFIDDTLANVESAISLGIDGLLFTSPEQFEHDLRTRGVL